MKLKHLIPLAFCSLLIYSCQWGGKNPVKAEITKDTLAYTYKTFKQRADDCGNKPDNGCTIVSIKYPVFKNEPALNDSLKSRLNNYFSNKEKADTSFTVMTTKLMDAYKQDLKSTKRKGLFYTMETTATVARQDSSLTALQIDGYTYTGGAHGTKFTSFINWNTKARKNLKLEDVLVPDYLPRLNKVAEKIFRKQENLSDTSSLARDYFFKDAKFSINSNFMLTPVGIRFLYNQYEIKPYAAGQTDLVVPYTQIKQLLKPNTVIAQYLK